MSFFKNLLKSKDEPISTYADFWKWFRANEAEFAKLVRKGSASAILEEHFFNPLSKDRLTVDYNIYKDKYWQSFNRFITYHDI